MATSDVSLPPEAQVPPLHDRVLLLAVMLPPFVLVWLATGSPAKYSWLAVIPQTVALLYFWRRSLGLFARAWMAPAILVSSCGLLAWVFLFHPDLSDLVRKVPRGSPLTLLGAGVLFSVLNAIGEEVLFRGIVWNLLDKVFRHDWAINVGQAALFGVMHIHGFPRGWIGVLMAALYGLVLGEIRKHSGGLLAPIVTHAFADATIFSILCLISTGTLTAT
jgi:membrane protease YdiL (CAAX protease family)